MFTGEMLDVHGTHSESLFFDSGSVAEELSEEGYRTIGVSSNYLVSETLGFDRGFDFFASDDGIFFELNKLDSLKKVFEREQKGEYNSKLEKYRDFLSISLSNFDLSSIYQGGRFLLGKELDDSFTLYGDSGADITNRLVEREVSSTEEEFFLFVNYMETHQPFRVPNSFNFSYLYDPELEEKKYLDEVWNSNLQGEKADQELIDISKDFYDTTIRYLDTKIEELYRLVNEESDDFVFIVVGDHGEMLGDENVWGHQNGIWEELIRVPAIVAGPGVDAGEENGYFSLRRVYDIIKGENPRDLTSSKVFADYRGVKGFSEKFGDGKPPEDEKGRKYYFNKSKAVVENGELYVENTELLDKRYGVRDGGKGKLLEAVEVPNSIKIRFGSDLDNLEF
jgi:arylsulfatase A-like enzyme